LFETRADALCDAIVVVSAPAWLQRQRVLRRPGMSPSRLASILAAQMPDREKRRHADFVVETGLGRGLTLRRLARALKILRRGDWRRKASIRRALQARR
jgi:dephospho-CoA kinase